MFYHSQSFEIKFYFVDFSYIYTLLLIMYIYFSVFSHRHLTLHYSFISIIAERNPIYGIERRNG